MYQQLAQLMLLKKTSSFILELLALVSNQSHRKRTTIWLLLKSELYCAQLFLSRNHKKTIESPPCVPSAITPLLCVLLFLSRSVVWNRMPSARHPENIQTRRSNSHDNAYRPSETSSPFMKRSFVICTIRYPTSRGEI